MRRIAVLLGLLIAGCGGEGGSQTMNGSVVLKLDPEIANFGGIDTFGAPCDGAIKNARGLPFFGPEIDDVTPGATVEIRNGAGETVAKTALGAGKWESRPAGQSNEYLCRMPFTSSVPDEQSYRITVATQPDQTFKKGAPVEIVIQG